MGLKEKNKTSYNYVIYGLIICHYHSHCISEKSLQKYFGSKNIKHKSNEIKQLLLIASLPRLEVVHPKGSNYSIKSLLKTSTIYRHIQGK